MAILLSDKTVADRRRRRMNRDIQKLIATSEDLLLTTASYTGAGVEDARSRLKQQLDSARTGLEDFRASAGDAMHRGSEAMQRGYDYTEEYVRAHPWQVAGVALGLAAIIAMCVAGCSSSSSRR